MLAKSELGVLLDTEGITELKGVSANPGIVRGVARILLANDIEESRRFRTSFAQGEILVTEMTQPNIMDIAKRAGGIVTDEGGMLSHAAIISREFRIPCVVGTHKATKVLKDGDMVEVDAEKGVVKVLGK
jgi:pyruvate,water dikinase